MKNSFILLSIVISLSISVYSQEFVRSFEIEGYEETKDLIVPFNKLWVLKKIEYPVFIYMKLPGNTHMTIAREKNKMRYLIAAKDGKTQFYSEGPLYFESGTQIKVVSIMRGYYAFFDEYVLSE